MEFLYESFEDFRLNEIGDGSAKPFKVKGPSPKQVLKDMVRAQGDRTNDDGWLLEQLSTWKFSGDKGVDYEMQIYWDVRKKMGRPKRFIKNPKTYRKFEMRMDISFYAMPGADDGTTFDIDSDDKERTTNLNEQYRVLATVVDTAIPVINEVTKEFSIDTIHLIPKADKDEKENINNKRGKFYLAYLKKQIKKLRDKVTVSEDKFYGGFKIESGHRYTIGGKDKALNLRNESIVNEIGDRSVEPGMWLQSKYEPNHKGYSFVTKDEERYYAYFEKKPWKWLESQGFSKILPMKVKAWETSFGHLKGSMHGYGGELDFKSATNKGAQFEILSTYAEILEDFLKNNKSKVDVIIAKPEKSDDKDSRRLRLYQAFLDKTNIFKKVETVKVFGQDVILLYP